MLLLKYKKGNFLHFCLLVCSVFTLCCFYIAVTNLVMLQCFHLVSSNAVSVSSPQEILHLIFIKLRNISRGQSWLLWKWITIVSNSFCSFVPAASGVLLLLSIQIF